MSSEPPGEIYITRELGHGVTVRHAPPCALLSLRALLERGFISLHAPDTVNIADQVLYRITGYSIEHQALTLELLEDWRATPTAPLSEAEVEAIKTRWRETYGRADAAHHVDVITPAVPADEWATDHMLHLFNQIERRPTPAADDEGRHWMEARKTGLAIAVCNCGYSSGWIPRSTLPGRMRLLADHGTPVRTEP
ncbi:hypothetical protein U5640_36310 [Streptomyces sp. SS7]|uniref:hypothetical protein n=1 Tax=Streptomyces sp. SS7 TaxID=3108485 RepID=UPI0030ED24C9